MRDFLSTTSAQAVIWTGVLLILLVVGFYVVQRFREQSDEDRLTADELIANFQELHDTGDIDEKEFRTIKTVLRQQLGDESKDAEGTD